jgi:hypothetical protein
MMNGPEKSDLAIVAMKPANKANEPTAEASTGANAAEPVERRAGAKGECAPAKHALDSEPGSRVTGAGAYTASNCRHTPEVGAVCGKAARTVLCGGRDENRVPTATTARFHHAHWRRGCRVAARGARAAAVDAGDQIGFLHPSSAEA